MQFGAERCRECRRCWLLALQNAENTARWADVLFVLLLLWLARVLCGPFFPLGFWALWRAPPWPQNAAIYSVLLRPCFRAGLLAVLFRLGVLGPLARSPPCDLTRLGPCWGSESWHPSIIWDMLMAGVGKMQNLPRHIIHGIGYASHTIK